MTEQQQEQAPEQKRERRTCEPCSAGTPPLTESERGELMKGLKGWSIEDNKLIKSFALKDFMGPMEMANKVAALAEEMGHHPDLHIRWGELKVTIWTHKIDNLSQADFILAEEIETLV